MVKVLFVCMGNICRSPTAEGVFANLVEREGLSHLITTDSAGTHAYHVGEPPDDRAQAAAQRRGIDLSNQRARKFAKRDFDEFDYIVAMDQDNRAILESACPAEHSRKIRLFLEFATGADVNEVPDPYYGGHTGFERVLDLVEAAADGLLQDIRKGL
jgi:protein-tyrosine phosphatase